MRIGGKEVSGVCEEVLVLPRPMGEDIVIIARACGDMQHFDDVCPRPKAPQRIVKGGAVDDANAPSHLEALESWGERRFAYICVTSLAPSNIEWDQVKMDKPSSWPKWQEELQSAGFSSAEVNRTLQCILSANSLDESKLKAARESFLLGQAAARLESSGQDIVQPSTPSGPLANDSE